MWWHPASTIGGLEPNWLDVLQQNRAEFMQWLSNDERCVQIGTNTETIFPRHWRCTCWTQMFWVYSTQRFLYNICFHSKSFLVCPKMFHFIARWCISSFLTLLYTYEKNARIIISLEVIFVFVNSVESTVFMRRLSYESHQKMALYLICVIY